MKVWVGNVQSMLLFSKFLYQIYSLIERCEKPVSCQKQITINQTPAILTITLKRFDFLKGGGKINKSVTFRDSLNLSSVMSLGSKVSLKKLLSLF